MDLEKVALDLAYRQKIGRALRKKAAEDNSVLASFSPVIEHIKSNPVLWSGLAGAGLGGLYGLASGDEEDRWSRGLTGALAGGAAGAGTMLAGRTIKDIFGGGVNQSPSNNKLSPKVEANSVDLAKQIQELRSRGFADTTVGSLWDSFGGGPGGYIRNHPVLGSLLLGDIASHHLGSTAALINPKYSSGNISMYRKNIANALSGKDVIGDIASRYPDDIKGGLQQLYYDDKLLQEAIASADKNTPYLVTFTTKGKNGPVQNTVALQPELVRSFGRDPVQRGGTRAISAIKERVGDIAGKMKPKNPHGFYGKTHASIAEMLREARDFAKPVTSKVNPVLKKLLGVADKDLIGYSPTLGNRLKFRAGLYLGVPALQALLSGFQARGSAAKEIERLQDRYSQ